MQQSQNCTLVSNFFPRTQKSSPKAKKLPLGVQRKKSFIFARLYSRTRRKKNYG